MQKPEDLKNLLDLPEFKEIHDYYTSYDCLWNYNSQVNQFSNNNFYFTQMLFEKGNWFSDHAEKHVTYILKALSKHLDSPLELLRSKANLFVNRNKHYRCGYHVDMLDTDDYYTIVYNINTSNGGTEIKDGQFYKGNENCGVLFYGNTEHQSITQTDTYTRLNINVNFRMHTK